MMYDYQIVINTLGPKSATLAIFDEVNEANSSDILRFQFDLSKIRPEAAFVQIAQRWGVKKLVLLVEKDWPGLMFEPGDFGIIPDDFSFAIFTQEKWNFDISD